jgi:hypothetical protein
MFCLPPFPDGRQNNGQHTAKMTCGNPSLLFTASFSYNFNAHKCQGNAKRKIGVFLPGRVGTNLELSWLLIFPYAPCDNSRQAI